ncbi:MAG: diacylglycerol kinase family protein [Salegentibacter sp.]|uniref:Diacylglycerol kinase (ATP) n=1 Tax=Salegentibacter flavus TaxID=287099 RepID=A0A1I5CW28_9FLAO|nr:MULTISPECIES: diacylglycerol kinase family protein [Salegentibacter]MDR9457881.1 diacylglycerol kinase family protein [Salegentibacter sp.]SFN91143.1 diacylglycerol kinase (ATP) [Salegentibacter flavus]
MRDSFLGKRIRGGGYAIKGAWLLLRHEASIQVQFGIAIIVTISGIYFEITKTEWLFQFTAIGMVMAAEGLNSAIEALADFVHPDLHSKIGHIKDVAAGGVFFAALIAVIIGGFIYLPYIF